MSCCSNKQINIIAGSGSLTTIYSGNGSLSSSRTVNLGGNSLTLNGTQDLVYTDAGRLTLSLYVSGLDDSAAFPKNFLYTNHNGQLMSAPGQMGGMLPVAIETSGSSVAVVNFLTPVNVSEDPASITPPTGVAVNSVFEVTDSRANAGTNNITINFSGVSETLHGSASSTFVMNSDAAFARFRFLGSPIGWIVEK